MTSRMTEHGVLELLCRKPCGAFAVSQAYPDQPFPAIQRLLNALVKNGLATIDDIRRYHITVEGRKEVEGK